jgi:methyl-accepting chemotaxis protein
MIEAAGTSPSFEGASGNQMKVWQKILVAPAVAVVFLMLLGAVSYGVMKQQNLALEELGKNRFSGYQIAADSAQDISEVHSNVYRLLTWMANLSEDKVKKTRTEEMAKIDDVIKQVKLFAALPQLTDEERKLTGAVLPKLADYRRNVDSAIDISTVEVGMGMMAMQAADAHFQALLKEFTALVQLEKKLAQESYEASTVAANTAIVKVLGILLLAIALSVGIALVMSKVIVRPLKSAIDTADRIAGGDLGQDVEVVGTDETGQLLRALSEMTQKLRTLVGEVASGANMVSDTSAQIAQGNLDLSQRTEEQASTLEETASSMEELTSTVTQNAQNAKLASQLAVGASEVARKGGDVVGQVVTTMTGISDSSKKIADIISVIDGIAFQTNILALNAAVEAARAGEQGRGFAVVASEVRSLAQRSAVAAKEIKTLIGDSVDKVGAGTKLVGAAGETMQEVVLSVKKVSDLIAEIAAASQEQSSGIEQVNTAVTQMDHVVQQNASLVEEATAATESMKNQAAMLLRMVSRFKLGAEQVDPAPLHSMPARPQVLQPRAPVPIKVRNSAKLAPAFVAALHGPNGHASGGNGEWKEF